MEVIESQEDPSKVSYASSNYSLLYKSKHQQIFAQLDRQCPKCSEHFQRFIMHSNVTHLTCFPLTNSFLTAEVFASDPAADCVDCNYLLLLMKIHVKIEHLTIETTSALETKNRQRVLTILEYLLDDTVWLEACEACQGHINAFATHIQSEHQEELIVESESEMIKEKIMLPPDTDHNYFHISIPDVKDDAEVDHGADTSINEYLSNTPEKIYFKVHSTDNGATLYTCANDMCLAVCRNQMEMMEHSKEHLSAEVVEELKTSAVLATSYQTGRGMDVPVSDYQCDVCKQAFKSRQLAQNCLDLHERYMPPQNPTPSKPVTCHICEAEQVNAKMLQQHMQEVHGKSVRIVTDAEIRIKLIIKCPRCPQLVFEDITEAVAHRKQCHSWTDGPVLAGVRCCLHMDGSEKTIQQPRFEFNMYSKFIYEFHCICGKNFKSNEQDARRCLAVHTNFKSYVCPEKDCGHRYATVAALHQHERRSHGKFNGNLEDIVCPQCGRSIGKGALKLHLEWHKSRGEQAAKQRQQECPSQQPRIYSFCRKSCSNASRLRRHIRIVHQKVPS